MTTLDELRAVPDAAERARAAHEAAERAEQFAAEARGVRDLAMHEMRGDKHRPKMSLNEVATKVGVSKSLVAIVLR